jgi:5-methylcytosine-specific restriction endonuclease McrA
MANPTPRTVREQIAWSYANLARAHAALEDGATKYKKIHHIIRNKVYHGLLSGKMTMRSLFDDERLKMVAPQACYYCGSPETLVVDHLIPQIRGGPDEADNLIWACRSCNSSKQGRDMLAWTASKGFFPSILLLRRYIKIVARYCKKNGVMDEALHRAGELNMPFDVRLLPTKLPPLAELQLWVQRHEPETISRAFH